MVQESFEERTETPTPKKREEARKKGEVAKTRELPSVAVLLSGMMTVSVFAPYMYRHIQSIFRESLSLFTLNVFEKQVFLEFAYRIVSLFILSLLPLLAAIFITAVFSNIAQVGFMASTELIKPKLSKLNPLKGLKRLFSKNSLMELFKTLLKLFTVGGIAYLTVRGKMKVVPFLAEMEPNLLTSQILTTVLEIAIKCTLAMIFLVIIDFAYQKWEFEKRIKMTRKEVKDELKTTEGDPLIKSRIKSIQMQMARRRMMQEVPKADVVIVNPTHFSVALKYDPLKMSAPTVIAKGAGLLAQKIRDLAGEHDIPIVENQELARNLYAQVEIDQEVPQDLYHAVAEVLAYIYKLRGRYAHGK